MQRLIRHSPSRRMRFGFLAFLLVITAIPVAPLLVAGAQTITVSGARGTDIPSCGVPSSPCKTINYALTNRISDGDTLNVEPGTYAETLDINKSITLAGVANTAFPGPVGVVAAIMLEGVGTDRIITIERNVTVTISNLVIENGKSTGEGAGIANVGTLTLTDSVVRNNALGKFGHEKCDPCRGGGISNRGTMTLTNVTVSGNTANGGVGGGIFNGVFVPLDIGGGIYNGGTLTVTGSTIAGNTAGAGGGGGGILNDMGAQLSLTNSTVSGNNAPLDGGGIANLCGTQTTLANVTVAANTSGIYNLDPSFCGTSPGVVALKNSIVANSTVAENCAGAITSGDYNLDNGTTCGFNQSHDLSNVNPLLAPLAENPTGPIVLARARITQTHALLPGSAATDAGGSAANGCPATDQRGVPRPQGAACDIGAYEYVPAAPPSTATSTPTATATATATTTPPTTSTATATTAPPGACTPLAPNSPFAFAGFQAQWQRGEAIAPNFWGPTVTGGVQEPYVEAPGGSRLVQYFDKGRMELTNPSSGVVTNGLLANELITGQLQVGDATFQSRPAANIPIAGDPDNAGPTYAALGSTAAALLNPAPAQTGSGVTTSVAANGTITAGAPTTGSGPTALTVYDGVTQHNVPAAFAAYRDTVGLLTIGYAKSEPFLATVKVAGVQRQVMVQVFERRVLTYTATNPDPFKVEMGNIGQHYYRWRYCGL